MADFPEIPGYSIKKSLGQGGMAEVFLAIQNKVRRMVAVKVLFPEVFGNQRMAKRFVKEAQVLSKLNHPNIVSIYEIGQLDSCYYIAMEYCPDSLKNQLKNQNKMAPDYALYIIGCIAEALTYAHSRGIIHRDVKPDNILFRANQTPVLVDFGIAKNMDSNTKLTKTNASIGTPHYMSPEQCKGLSLDGRSDIYSLGVVLYEMLTGKPPYTANQVLSIMMKHMQEPVPQLPASLQAYQIIIDKMMAKNKSDRVKSDQDLLYYIKKVLVSQNSTALRQNSAVHSARRKIKQQKRDSDTKVSIPRRIKPSTRKITRFKAYTPKKSKRRPKKRLKKWLWRFFILLSIAAVVWFFYQPEIRVFKAKIIDFIGYFKFK
jgi:serine/threonine-protein kinase PpkA